MGNLFDAVAYVAGNGSAAYAHCRKLDTAARVRRRSRFGVRWWRLNQPGRITDAPECDRILACNDYASLAYTPADFTWEKIGDGVYGGMLTVGPERAAEFEKIAKGQVENDEKLGAAHAAALADRHKTALSAWRESVLGVMRRYYIAVADLAGVRHPDRLPLDRLQNLVAVADAPVRMTLDEYVDQYGDPAPVEPSPDQFQVGPDDADIDAFFEGVLSR